MIAFACSCDSLPDFYLTMAAFLWISWSGCKMSSKLFTLKRFASHTILRSYLPGARCSLLSRTCSAILYWRENSHVELQSSPPDFVPIFSNRNRLFCRYQPGTRAAFQFLFAGHEHAGGYFYDEKHHIHFSTLPSPLESQSDDPRGPYAILHVYESYLQVEGFGAIKSEKYDIVPF